jgi:hypothetical protein
MEAQPTSTNDQIFLNALDAIDRDTRISVGVDAWLCRGQQRETVSIKNLSLHGMLVKSESPPSVGAAVYIEIAGAGTFEGVVRWRNHNEFGIHLFESIDLALFYNPQEH